MKRIYNSLLVVTYIIAVLAFSISYASRSAFYLIWTVYHEVSMILAIAGTQFLHYLIYWKANKQEMLNLNFEVAFHSIDRFMYTGNLILLVLVKIAEYIPLIGWRVSAYYFISSAVLNLLILGLREYVFKHWD